MKNFLKKLSIPLLMILPLISISSIAQNANAKEKFIDEHGNECITYGSQIECTDSNTNNGTSSNGTSYFRSGTACPNFLGLTSWDCGLTSITSEADLKKNIWLIASNVATDIGRIATYLVLGYVIYGGYLYIFSAGDPGKAAAGKKTLTQAFIGLAIVMSASLIMGTIRATLTTRGDLTNCLASENACVDPNTMVKEAIDWFIGMSGLVAVIFTVYGGIQYITSAGEPDKIKKAKQMILYSLIGLAIVALSFAISAFVSSKIRSATPGTSYINQTITLKEVNETKIN
ncbi:hypothetical protein IKZ77_01190 [Candidatus Saccharibacteria bacterium]|nr:hypothetical protein [Candidatus Saccharibacteria bacterium]